MALSLDLISEFVKITKDETPQKQETITYGTVVKSDGSTYVKIDGAEVLTPIISTTNLADKERVTVMIKNHTAIVTGNITNPSARTTEVEDVAKELANTKILIADKVSTAELEAQKGRIDDLEADNVTINGKVTANEGEIKYLKSDEFSAKQITAITARIEEIASQKLTTDELYVALAEITVLAAGTATFDKATIQHLVAEAMNLKYGVADQVFIENLAVEYAQMVGATIGNLCVKASDGKYYTIDISPDGNVTATLTTVTEGEANAGQTDGGKVILETNIAADNLNASNLLATYALVNKIDAARIDVDQLFAREAFVNLLRTTKIVGDKTITMIAEDAEGGAVQIVEGASGQVECREGKGIYVYSDFEPKQELIPGKNLLPCTAKTSTVNGIAFAVNSDGTVSATGTASARAQLTISTVRLSQGSYILSQGFLGNSQGAVSFAQYTYNDSTTYIDLNDRTEGAFDLPADLDVKVICEVRVAGATVDNAMFYPMIRVASDTDDTYEPYSYTSVPYPAGGGKNIIPFTNSSNTYNGITVTVQDDGRLYINGTATGDRFVYNLFGNWKEETGITFEAGNKYSYVTNISGLDAIAYGYNSSGTYSMVPNGTLTESYTDVYVYFQVAVNTTVDGYFVPTLTSEGWSDIYIPYSNICPIIGKDSLEVVKRGKNLCSAIESGAYGNSNGLPIASTVYQRTEKILITEGEVYAHSNSRGWPPTDTHFWDADENWLGSWSGVDKLNDRPNGAVYVAFNYYGQELTWAQLEIGNSSTEYEPYNGSAYTIRFGDIVYGGHYDWQTGELLVQYGITTLNGTEEFVESDINGHVRFELWSNGVPGILPEGENVPNRNLVCSCYVTRINPITDNAENNSICGFSNLDALFIRDDRFSNSDDFKNWLSEHPIQIVYKLAEPYTIKYARQQILSYEGLNVIITDADNGRIEFGHDPMDFRIDSIESTQDNMNEKQNALDEEQKRVSTYFRIEPEMVRIGKEGVTSEFRIDPWGAGVAINNTIFSRFESDRVRFGNMEIRRPAIGGLAFDSIADEMGVSM